MDIKNKSVNKEHRVYIEQTASDHTASEGIEETSCRVLVEQSTDEVNKDMLPTPLTSIMAILFAGVWMGFHVFSYFTSSSYQDLVLFFGLNTMNPNAYEFVTSLFVHGNFVHLFVNIIAFLSFGGLLHRHLGSRFKYLIYFIVSGILAGFVQLNMLNYIGISQNIPIVGASGAICALFGYFAFSKPNSQIKLFFVINMKAKNAAVGFIALSIVSVSVWGVAAGGIAHSAHITGLVVGFSTAIYHGEIPNKPPLIDADYLGPLKQAYSLLPNRLTELSGR